MKLKHNVQTIEFVQGHLIKEKYQAVLTFHKLKRREEEDKMLLHNVTDKVSRKAGIGRTIERNRLMTLQVYQI